MKGERGKFDSAILILGDSVTFGPAVSEEQTFAGRLRQSLFPVWIFNASVIGHGVHDYKNAIEYFLPGRDKIHKVFLVFCLNDITAEERAAAPNDIIDSMRGIALIYKLNAFLLPRSKLYLFLKQSLINAEKRAWRMTEPAFTGDASVIQKKMQPISDIAKTLAQRGIEFVVIIAPLGSQLDSQSNAVRRPQQMLAEFFEKSEIAYFDALPVFKSKNLPSKRFFLPGDPWHFSAYGHEVMHETMMGIISGELSLSPRP